MPYVLPAIEVMELIPSHYPICHIDYVDTLESGKKIVATRSVAISEDFFQGHFPGNPTMPDVLTLEALTQADSTLILKPEEFLEKRAYIGGINKAKSRQRAVSRGVLKRHLEITKMKGLVGTALSATCVDGKKVYECESTFIIDQNT